VSALVFYCNVKVKTAILSEERRLNKEISFSMTGGEFFNQVGYSRGLISWEGIRNDETP
jgi:hypothetical protein